MTKPKWTDIKIKLGDIIPWDDNPRMSNKAQAQRLIDSEKHWGQPMTFAISPFKDGKADLYDGHQRYSAWLTVYGEDYLVDVRQCDRHLTDEERIEFVVTMHAGATGSWDWQKLASFPAPKLIELGFDEALKRQYDFDANNIKELLNSEKVEPVDAEPQIDRAAELQVKWQTVSGQLWKLGKHRLLIGDCTVRENVERLMGEEKIDLLFTSPPYNQGGENRNGDLATNGNGKVSLYEEYGDKLSDDDYKELLYGFIENAEPLMAETHSVVVNISYNSNARDLYGKVLFSDRNPFTVRETIVWDKKSALNFPNSGIYSRRCEFIFVMSKSKTYLFSEWSGTRWNYYEVSKENQIKEHRAAFPLPLAERVLSEFSKKNSVVYEPFCGTGTAILAAHNLGRKCYSLELSEKYGAVILQRFFDATGIQPELVE